MFSNYNVLGTQKTQLKLNFIFLEQANSAKPIS